MQLSLTFAFVSALIATAIANPVSPPHAGFSLAGGAEEGAYTFDQHGNITSFTSATVLQRRMQERGEVELSEREDSVDLSTRGSTGINCFNAKFSGSNKLNAVNAMFSLLDDYSVIPAGGAVATQYGNSSLYILPEICLTSLIALGNAIVYVCNFDTVQSQNANANDVHPEDNTINKKCGSNTAGRDRFSSK